MRKTQSLPRLRKPDRKQSSPTVHIPRPLAGEHQTVDEFVAESLKEKLRRLQKERIDEAFSGMATDEKYQAETLKISGEFQTSDWHALKRRRKVRNRNPVAEPGKLFSGSSLNSQDSERLKLSQVIDDTPSQTRELSSKTSKTGTHIPSALIGGVRIHFASKKQTNATTMATTRTR